MKRFVPISALLFALSVSGAQQPVPFSHHVHVGDAKLGCSDCHEAPAKFGDRVSVPDAPKCLECHAYSTKPTPTKDTLAGFAAKNQPIAWVITTKLKDFVFFDHRYHLTNGAECTTCHGVEAAEENTTKMTFCQPCHVKSGARAGCNTCHDTR